MRLIPIDDIAVKKNQFFEFDPNDTKYQSSYPIPNIYPFDPYVSGDTKRPGAIIFIWTAYVRSKQLFPNYVTAAQLVYDEKFNLPKLGVDSGFKKNPNL
ncbi:hypothetical protein CJD36_002765 [Flavipsychrobacter stenotrophus]|uniref:Uncharacterized protein n=1 Tax=Flavipsychrobacter stenotrophus TaxID=2077091 RepID=A0A2S7T0F1_9BACT|nr:hypothetical protein [Flavipsychrobacter stenotrophus]PQJ12683.1 hypothetical protein CJD36_002765 [Flavipsychrobacter stenotrophus]